MSRSSAVGKVQTVTGPVEPQQLGPTMMHEHLFVDLRMNNLPDGGSSATDVALSMEKLTLHNAARAREA